MHVEITITPHAIPSHRELPSQSVGEIGAVAEFEGLVRREENGKAIAALEYEAYEPMAQQVMRRIVEEIGRTQPCFYVQVKHRVGMIPVGEAAIRVRVASRHRGAAFAMLTGFMDRLKQDVPIWKRRAIPLSDVEPEQLSANERGIPKA